MASSTDSSFKIAYVKDDASIGFLPVAEDKKNLVIFQLAQLLLATLEISLSELHRKLSWS